MPKSPATADLLELTMLVADAAGIMLPVILIAVVAMTHFRIAHCNKHWPARERVGSRLLLAGDARQR